MYAEGCLCAGSPLSRAGEEVKLSPKEYELLRIMVQQTGIGYRLKEPD
ncbi:MAG: hypothetical protein ACREDO_03390 [Methyloceanibacter sp.]